MTMVAFGIFTLKIGLIILQAMGGAGSCYGILILNTAVTLSPPLL